MFPIKDTLESSKKPFMTWLIIAVNISVFFWQLGLTTRAYNGFLYEYAFISRDFYGFLLNQPLDVLQYYPLLTNQFLHGGWFHIISNLWILWIFGDNVEDRMGHFHFLAFYLLCGMAANLAQFLLDPVSSIPLIGASGAIAGVMGAYLILFPGSRILTLVPIVIIPFFFKIPAFIFLLLWFFSQVLSGASQIGSGEMGGVAWWAHIGGFIAGVLLFGFFLEREEPRKPRYYPIDHPLN